jgi:Tfp pilus assembly protein FimV
MVAIHLLREEAADWPVTMPPEPGALGPPPGPRPVRVAERAAMYRRRRLAALVLVTSVVLGGVAGVSYIGSLAAPDGAPVPIDAGPPRPASSRPGLADGHVYVVQPGDTLWSIAAAVAPNDDPRSVVDRLREANGTDVLQAGDRLVIDAG